MSKKQANRKSAKKAVSPSVVAAAIIPATAVSELSYNEMLNELEAIVIEADMRLAEEEVSL